MKKSFISLRHGQAKKLRLMNTDTLAYCWRERKKSFVRLRRGQAKNAYTDAQNTLAYLSIMMKRFD